MTLTHEDLGMKPVEYLDFSAMFSDGSILDGLKTKVSLNESDEDLIKNLHETGPKHWFEGGVKVTKIIRHKTQWYYSTDWHSEKTKKERKIKPKTTKKVSKKTNRKTRKGDKR